MSALVTPLRIGATTTVRNRLDRAPVLYAEPHLPRRVLGGGVDAHDGGRWRNSDLCVPAQMLGMKGACYNPEVVKVRGGA